MEDRGGSTPLKKYQQRERAERQSHTGDLTTDPALIEDTRKIPVVHLPGYDDEGGTTIVTTAVGTGSKEGLTQKKILNAARMEGLRKYKDSSSATSGEEPEHPLIPPEWKEDE